jgi:hypothetical protein
MKVREVYGRSFPKKRIASDTRIKARMPEAFRWLSEVRSLRHGAPDASDALLFTF